MRQKIGVEYYSYETCECCGPIWGWYVLVNGEYLTWTGFDNGIEYQHTFSSEVEAIQFALDHLDIPVEVSEYYSEGEEE